MATHPDSPPDTIEPQSPDEISPPPEDPDPGVGPDEQPVLPPDSDQPGVGPPEIPDPI